MFEALMRVSGFELRGSCLLGWYSTTWATTSALIWISYFSDRIPRFFLGRATTLLPMASLIAWTTDTCHHAHLIDWVGEGLTNFLPGLASNYDPHDLHLLNCWDYDHEPLCLA
jgi:hypothetical protein